MKLVTIKHQKGFTLVEMLVSISLFTVVLTMSVGTLLILIDANGRAQSMQLVMTNLTFALDSMTREVRTGFNWYCESGNNTVPSASSLNDCGVGSPGNFISVVESGNNLTRKLVADGCHTAPQNCSHRISYWFDPDGHGNGHGAIYRRLGDESESGMWVPLTGPEIWVDEMRLIVTGTDRQQSDSDPEQPEASIYIRGRAGVSEVAGFGVKEREFDIQTTVSQRLLDI